MIRSDKRLKLLYAAGDLITLFSIFTIINLIFRGENFVQQDFLFLITISLIWFYLTSRNRVYYQHLHNTLNFRVKNHLRTHFEFIAIISLFYLVIGIPVYTRVHFVTFIISFPVIDILVNCLFFLVVNGLRRRGKNLRKALIVGAGRSGDEVGRYFYHTPDLGYKIIGYLDDDAGKEDHIKTILGSISDIDQVLKEVVVDEVIIALPTHLQEKIQYVIGKVDYYGIRVRLVPDYSRLLGRNYKTSNFGDIPVINVREISLDRLRLAFLKQVFDFLFSLTALIMLAPLFLLIAVLIKMESQGPVFYCPIRLGQAGRKFKLYKFRSMYANDQATGGTMSTQKNDPRVTPLGKILRKYSLDELPQFINVMLGEMSVVGPRPHRIFLNQVMQKEVDHYMIRHYLKPGITGWAQVNGWRGPTDTDEQKNGRTTYDLWYVENWTPLLDVKIIFLTIFGSKTYRTAF